MRGDHYYTTACVRVPWTNSNLLIEINFIRRNKTRFFGIYYQDGGGPATAEAAGITAGSFIKSATTSPKLLRPSDEVQISHTLFIMIVRNKAEGEKKNGKQILGVYNQKKLAAKAVETGFLHLIWCFF